MGTPKTKLFTVDEQINFIRDARKILEDVPDAEIFFRENSADILRKIEENLLTIKMWMSLPDLHQAALHILDKAFNLQEEQKLLSEDSDSLYHFASAISKLTKLCDEKGMERIAGLSMIAVSRFVLRKDIKEEVSHD